MASALRIDNLPVPACEHSALIPYGPTNNDSTDDTITMKGRCPECSAWVELWISRTTGETWDERALDAGEIADLRRAEIF